MRAPGIGIAMAGLVVAAVAHAAGGDITPACKAYGQAAAAFAADRNSGTSFSSEVASIRRRAPTPEMADFLIDIADAIYHKPGSNLLDPEGALFSYAAECQVNHERIAGGGRNIVIRPDVEAYLADFKTFNGTPLKTLLAKIGVRVESIQTEPLHPNKVRPGDREGDMALTFILAGHIPRSAPCGLARWAPDGLPPAELMRRGAQFPLLDPDSEDPIIYWAATGKCSAAYSF